MNLQRIKQLLCLFSVAVALPTLGGPSALELESQCRATYPVEFPNEDLGSPAGKLTKNHLYQMFDPLLGGVVFVLSDTNGNLVPRPLGRGSVLECSYGSVKAGGGETGMCALEKGSFVPLLKGDPRAISRSIYRLVYTGDWTGRSLLDGFEWEHGQEIRLSRRDPKDIKAIEVTAQRKLANEVIVAKKSVPKFYRKNNEYWGYVDGDNFPIKQGHWMQLFADGNYHLVKLGYHLEQWPGEDGIMVEVKDDEELIKIGKGEQSFVLAEKVLGKGIDWKTYFKKNLRRPANPRVSASKVCTRCEEPEK